MNREDLDLIINEGEGLTVEFKESYTPRISRDIVALSNTKGGYLLLGVADDGNIKGVKLTNKLKSEIIDLARNCEPSIEIKEISSLGKIIIIKIEEGSEKPYSCSEGYYRRLDAVTQKMTQKEIKTIFTVSKNISFESQFCTDFKIKDIALKKIKGFLNEAKTSFKVTKINLASFLMSLGIYKKDKINNAGILMFAKNIEKYIPYSELVLVAFKGKDKTYIYDRRDIRNDLLIQLNESVEFLRKHLNIRSEIRGMDRYDIYEIPIDALREALVNAIVHRDYSLRGTSIYVEIYDDRVVIVNPGGVPSGITKSNFGKESIRRNLIIADLFHRMGKVERIGSGIGKMKSLIESSGLKPPDFELENFFRVTFYRDLKFSLKKVLGEKMGSEIKVGERVGE
ncbi:putative DNA binding domain-containing protein, partial [Candidatus Dependentiae bacterium]|nr:putative DNA binding domain-containing protein [Candidatus Dependentiae bacterium]